VSPNIFRFLEAACSTPFGVINKYLNSSFPTFMGEGDFNCDTELDIVVVTGDKLDLVITKRWANSVGILRGNGDGTFQKQKKYLTGDTANSVTARDFNNDGKMDLAVANGVENSVTILLNLCF
jgi:hypothetical protein